MLRLHSPIGRVAALAAALLATASLSACRTIEGESTAEVRPAQKAAPDPVRASVEVPAEAALAPSTPAPAPSTPAVVETTPEVAASTPPTTPAAEPDPAQASPSAAAAGPNESGVLGTTASSGPPEPLDPWRLVGQPYLVDDEAPNSAADGLTTFTLWFRTQGEFRGVRQGTSVTDDRHYKVGLITVPELPGFVPGGIGMVQRSERALQKGRYCYTAEVHLKGEKGTKRFPIYRNGAELQVVMDLKGAPIQRRTATVVVRSTPGDRPPITPVEKALACR